jgi:benzoate membrane transport protein
VELALAHAELNAAAVSAGLTGFIWFACGALPLQLALSATLGLSTGGVFIVWATGGAASIVLSLRLRQPIPIAWSIPALVYVASLTGRFNAAEIAGATLVSAVMLAAFVLAGGGSRLMRWLPMPIVMATFAGSLLEYMHRAVAATVADAMIAGAVVAGYFAARLIASPRVPPVGVALVVGGLAVAVQGPVSLGEFAWSFPTLEVPRFQFDPAAITAISVPLVVFALGLGNAQGLGFLRAQGYEVPVDRVSRAVAMGSLINALFGGTPATVARNAAALLAGPDAGPSRGRYWGVLICSALTVVMACALAPFAALIAALPASFAVTLAGVALVSSLQDALEKAFAGPLRFGALLAFVVAATPFSLGGITSGFWALVAGVLASLVARERGLPFLGLRKQKP